MSEKLERCGQWVVYNCARFIRGLVLFGWIAFLGTLAISTLTFDASSLERTRIRVAHWVDKLTSPEPAQDEGFEGDENILAVDVAPFGAEGSLLTPSELLRTFMSNRRDIANADAPVPPLRAVLNALFGNFASWDDVTKAQPYAAYRELGRAVVTARNELYHYEDTQGDSCRQAGSPDCAAYMEKHKVLKSKYDELLRGVYDANRRLSGVYDKLFDGVITDLQSVADDDARASEEYYLSESLIPAEFRPPPKPMSPVGDELIPEFFEVPPAVGGSLPRPAISWISKYRAHKRTQRERVELMRIFLLLVVLGGLGSVIFLTRTFIADAMHDSPDLRISAYVFRPVFGMFLAIGLFVVDAMAHAIIARGSITDLRNETILVLGLAAGLLSERAYVVIETRAKSVLAEKRNEAAPEPEPEPEAKPAAGEATPAEA